jgi:hypothetical protein
MQEVSVVLAERKTAKIRFGIGLAGVSAAQIEEPLWTAQLCDHSLRFRGCCFSGCVVCVVQGKR